MVGKELTLVLDDTSCFGNYLQFIFGFFPISAFRQNKEKNICSLY